ncbi:MAG: restriction endonuclease subunit S, partial [Campylobacter lanienae]|nr:restriction endonuclease subunit S [Campylobacteraceae bacterium]MDY2817726.1 restriction endonuclease subunit S [Campylobacter lanienae]
QVKNGKYPFFTCAKEVFKIDKFAFDFESLLISGNGANVGYIHYYNGKFNAYQRTYVLYNFKKNIFFLKYILENFLHDRIEKEKNASNTPFITLSTIKDMRIRIPNDIKEQEAIGEFFRKIDGILEFSQKKITKLENIKKYLLNKMFV